MSKEETKYLYYQLDFYEDGSYQCECIAKDLQEVHEILKCHECVFDEKERNAVVKIKGIGLTKATYEAIEKEQVKTYLN